ncbi:hypothetical protein [Saccharicrinis aurantiacus]|uniref:hypothetical protein n=1 Tax=Saccharicrinis aurantiacus TaxID=1849719 RepID=UPI0008387797|nr:hypothetical protein [Saccharicrinis aurantiacus]
MFIKNFFVNVKMFLATIYHFTRICFTFFRGYNGINNIACKNSIRQKELKILGNGNSLKKSLHEISISDYDFMVVNRHVLSESYNVIKPKYYILADPHFYSHEEGIGILSKVIKQTSWELNLFLPFEALNSKTRSILNNIPGNIKVTFFNTRGANGFSFYKYWLYNKNLSMPIVQNVMVAATYLAISLKYKRVDLYGVEHSWLKYLSVNDNNEVCLENPHFYDKGKTKKQTWYEIQHVTATLSEVLRAYANMFESYLEVEAYARKKQVAIVNKTANSYIDAFRRE